MALSKTLVLPATAKAELITPAVELYGYQKRWLADKSRFKIGMQARQTGKTFTTTLELVLEVMDAMVHQQKNNWVILSRGERQAKEAMETGVHVHAKAIGAAVESLSDAVYVGDDGTQYKQLECRFDNGSKILALPANPDTARGFSANVFLDEFAFHKDSHKIWTALFPVISAREQKIRITSTPNGKNNKFYELFTDIDSVWSKHSTDIYQAIADGLPRDAELLKKALRDDDAWAQEFELKWLDEATAWLPFDLITSCESEFAGVPALYQKNPCFVGVDIGLRRDLFVIWVFEQIGDVLWTRDVVTLHRAKFAEQDAALARVMRLYNVVRVCMDQTGMGEKPVEDAKRNHGSMRVEGVIFSMASKQLLATQGKQAFEDRKLRIPIGDDVLRSDLHKLKRETTATGAARFVADSDSEGHADRAWACFLAVHAAGGRSSAPEYVQLNAADASPWLDLGGAGSAANDDDDCDSAVSAWRQQ